MGDPDRNVYLTGFMGAGKTTVGKLLAKYMNRAFIDMDEQIEASSGASIQDIFTLWGATAFRDMEAQALENLALRRRLVVATGGGIVERAENRATMCRSGIVVYLRIDAPTALARVGDPTTRPLLAGLPEEQRLAGASSLLAEREPLYAAADITTDANGPPQSVLASLLPKLREAGVA